MPDDKSEARSNKLRALFGKIVSGKANITSNNAALFIEALCAQGDRALCLQKIVASQKGYAALQSALGSDTQLAFLKGSITAFLRYLAAPELRTLCGGSITRRLILKFVEEELVWNALIAAFGSGELDPEGEEAFSWLLAELVFLPKSKALEFTPLALDKQIRERLLQSSSQEVRLRGRKIVHIVDNITVKHENLLNGPGGRHDNDFADIRKIEILPTSDELASKDPYLPRTQEANERESHPGGLAFHVDSQFRLLREDMLRDLREEVQAAHDVKKGRRKSLSVEHLTLAGVYCDGRNPWSLQFRCTQDLPQMPNKSEKIRRQFLQDNKKFMRHESVARVVTDGNEVTLGTIIREEDLLVKNPPVLCLQIPGNELERALRCLLRAESIKVVQLNTAVFAYLPILKQLQEIKDISVEHEILRWETGKPLRPVDYSLSPEMSSELYKLGMHKVISKTSDDLRDILRLKGPTKLDQAQTMCFLSGLRDKVSLIQGPPGTGKSFIGSLLAKAIYTHSKETILVVCYTHHALDQFLEELLKMGIPDEDMVRLGSVSKATPRTRPLAIKQATFSVRFSREQGQILGMARTESSDEGGRLRHAFTNLEQAKFSKDDILEHLEFRSAGPPYYSAFEVPNDPNDMVKISKKGKAVDRFYLLDRWWRGKDAGTFKRIAVAFPEVWGMKPVDRIKARREWESEMLNDRLDAVRESGTRYDNALDRISSVYMEKELVVLRRKRVIACTTTAAAKYVQCLKSVYPGVLLVEEAGEILESHILTALSPDTKQLILIGDHKQLRPKVHYHLSVEKGEGYDLNRSLFERLVLRGYPHHTLHQQHRMRPELAEFVRNLTYPDLVDAERTKNRPDIRGLQKNVVFLNHTQPEVDMEHVPDWKDNASPSSKRNPFEAKIILKCIRYLGQQDYKTDNIVVLTPHLGQLRLLMDELGKDSDPILNDLDSHDLVRAGLMPMATAKVAKPRIRISTIELHLQVKDNFQGEERDLVLVSLTRSNSRCDIGFMPSPQRLNVLLSRARDGLILVGDAETFMGSKKGGELWTHFVGMLKEKNYIFDGLPVKCERHPKRLVLLKTPEDFENESPDGGCKEPCGSLLSCGAHKCPRSCHHRSDHSGMQCEHIVEYKCPNGHWQNRKCHKSQLQTCRICQAEDERRQKQLEADLKLQEIRDKEKARHELEIVKLDLQIQTIHEQIKQKETAKERANALELKKQDLEAAKLHAKETFARAAPELIIHPAVGTMSDEPSSTNLNASARQDLKSKRQRSEPEVEWERQKDIEGATNDAIDSLMRLTGLESVKDRFLEIKAKMEAVARRGSDVKKERMGKTTVARIYARFLASIGALPGKEFVEIAGSGLAHEGVAGAKKMIDGLLKAGGGVFFIDEAYQLASSNNFGGRNVLDFILTEIEERRGTIAFILAGYTSEMEKFFEHNPGFHSRMPQRLHFADYSDDDLLIMLDATVEQKYNGRAKLADGTNGIYARILVKRLGRKRGTEGYGNARALENVWAQVTERQAVRLRKERAAGRFPDDFLFTQDDLIGPEPQTAIKESEPWKELEGLIGLRSVKYSVRALVDSIQLNYQRELKELPPLEFSLHRVFLGSPGTGKTTVAKLYGSILADLSLLSKREVVMKNPSDFVGGALGQSEENTKRILKVSEGKVLVIDEAYGMDPGGRVGGGQPDPYKRAVIDTIVAQVQNTPGEDRCVLLLGYKDPMESMLNHCNPGLARRFRLSDAFHFEDFNDEELRKILDLKLKKQGIGATDEAKHVAVKILARERDRPNFGNAGAVENLISRAKEGEHKRRSQNGTSNFDPDVVFLPQDFDEKYDRGSQVEVGCRELFADIVGCDKLISQLDKYQDIARNMNARGLDPRDQIPFSFIFKGPPGTGKTTVARKISELYYQMGILTTNEYVDCSASDLIGTFVGHTGPKTQAKLTEARGRVLFVDEAYRFCDGGFGKEAVNELVDCMTKPSFAGKLVVILAGYTKDMDNLLQLNPGLSSRFPEEVVFSNMAPEECLVLLEREIKKSLIDVVPPIKKTLSVQYHTMTDTLMELSKLPNWGNGRDIKNLAKSVSAAVFANTAPGTSTLSVGPSDILRELGAMLQAQKARCAHAIDPHRPTCDLQLPQLTSGPPDPIRTMALQTTRLEEKDPTPVAKEGEEPQDTSNAARSERSVERDPGVTDEIWQQLQASVAVEESAHQRNQEHIMAQDREVQAQQQLERTKLDEMKRIENLMLQAEKERKEELERQYEEEKQKALAALKARREAEERRRKALEEAERRRRQEEAIQKKLQDLGVCPAGFRWSKMSNGYRCRGGSHFMSNVQLGI